VIARTIEVERCGLQRSLVRIFLRMATRAHRVRGSSRGAG
jgi:hypothetical protein